MTVEQLAEHRWYDVDRKIISFSKTAELFSCERHYDPRNAQCFLACSGISRTKVSVGTPFSSGQEKRVSKYLTVRIRIERREVKKGDYTMSLKVEKWRKGPAIGQTSIGIA